MILFLYNAGLLLALILGAPWWLWRLATTSKYREGLGERLGRVPKRLAERRLDADQRQSVIWLHAVSVGEVLAVSRLVAELDTAEPAHRVFISTTTRTGQVLARQRFGAERVFYCPLDLPWAVSAYLDALKPALLILAETEFWPNLLTGCHQRGIPVAVVNARISDRSWPRYQRLRSLWEPFLRRLALVLAQSDTDADRLRSLGCSPVSVSGNLKFDVRNAGESAATAALRHLSGSLRLLVAGSTLEGEETALLAAWPALLSADPALAMVLAPRHPERFASVAELLASRGFPWRRRSNLGDAPLAPGEIVLLDTIGELASVYSLAAVAFVGGSLIPAGGHNPLEPAQFGVPVVMGRHYRNFQAMVDDLLDEKAIAITTPADLQTTLVRLLRNPAEAAALGARGKAAFAKRGGATARTISAIAALLHSGGRP